MIFKNGAFFIVAIFYCFVAGNVVAARPAENCPDCTRAPKTTGQDATQEVNQLAQTLQSLAQQVQQQNTSPCSNINGNGCTCPATQNQCSSNQCQANCQCQQNSDDALEQTVLSNFATMVQSFFNIVQNPHNGNVVSNNIAQMFMGIVNVAKEVLKRMPESVSLEEKEAYLEEVETALKSGIRSITRIRKHLKFEEMN